MTTPAASVTGVVIPVRGFADGFARLAGRLDADGRARLARRLADCAVDAAAELPVVVVSSAPDVRAWADERGLERIDDPRSLDEAADAGRERVRALGCARVVVVHADLPRLRSLAEMTTDEHRPVAALVACHRGDGTPVLSVPVAAPFRFAYGPGSFRRHEEHARGAGLTVRVVRDPDLAFDVDEPQDLDALAAEIPQG